MNELERKLVDKILVSYMDKGINVQRLVDNPDFIALPLESKIGALNHYASVLTTPPTKNYTPSIKAGLMAGTATGLSVLAARASTLSEGAPLISAMGKPVLAAAGIAAGIGLYSSLRNQMQEYNESKAIGEDIQKGDYLKAIVDNGIDRRNNQQALNSFISKPNPIISWISDKNKDYFSSVPGSK